MKLYHFINRQYGLAAIRDQQYKLSTYDELNDPFELFATTLVDKTIRETFHRFKNDMAEIMGFLCCSKNWKSTLLWSHYADKHRGLALELNVDDKIITHITYKKDRIEIDKSKMDSLVARNTGTGVGSIVMQTKSIEWAYENEARIQFDISHLELTKKPFFMPFNEQIELTGVVLGPLCTLSLEEIENSIPIGKELTVRKSRIAFGSFDVVNKKDFDPVRLRGKA